MNHVTKREALVSSSYVALRRTYRLIDEITREELRPHKLSPPQYSVLRHATAEGVSITEISSKMLADNGNLTRHIDKLAARGLIKRAAKPSDRRTWLIKLTPAGSELMDHLRPIRQKHIAELFAGLNLDELKRLSSILVKFEKQLGAKCERDQFD